MTKILIAVSLLSFISCGPGKVKKDTITKKSIAGWKTFKEANYSVQYPPDWELNHSGQMGTSFIMLAALESGEDKFRENVNLLIQDLTGRNMDLGEYAELSEGQVKTMVTNGVLIESKKIKTDSDEYHRIMFTGDQGEYHLEFEQYYRVNNNKAYVLTFTGEQNRFKDYKEKGEAILNSFSLTK